jgi:hypothetical protein
MNKSHDQAQAPMYQVGAIKPPSLDLIAGGLVVQLTQQVCLYSYELQHSKREILPGGMHTLVSSWHCCEYGTYYV